MEKKIGKESNLHDNDRSTNAILHVWIACDRLMVRAMEFFADDNNMTFPSGFL